MKLNQALSLLNQIEKSKFINCLDRLCTSAESCNPTVSKTLDKVNRQIKDASGSEITQLFNAVRSEYKGNLTKEISMAGAAMALLVNILSRDGNGVARVSWIEQLYQKEWLKLDLLAKELATKIDSESENDFGHTHRLKIFSCCLREAYFNDERSNRDAVITDDERGILNVLAKQLMISNDEVSAIEHMIDPVKSGKEAVELCIQGLREIGALFVHKKKAEVIVVDEIVEIFNEIQGKSVADKYLVRIMRALSDAELSNILKKYGKPIRGVSRFEKISTCLRLGLDVNDILSRDIFAPAESLTNKKDRLKQMISDLDIQANKIGSTLDERIGVILEAFRTASDQEAIMLTPTRYKEMYDSLNLNFVSLDANNKEQSLEARLQREFELEDSEDINTDRLRALSITPADILYSITNDEIKLLRDKLNLPKRGNPRLLIIQTFESVNDRLIENYDVLARRDMNALKAKGIEINESEVGIKFEEATKTILEALGLVVDEDLRKEINTPKDKVDIILSISEDDVIIGEAKTFKNGDFAKYSSTSRQVKAYAARCENYGKRVAQVLIIAPSFSDDFVSSAEMDPEINLSLLTAEGLKLIYESFKSKRKATFSPKLLSKGGLLKADLIARSI